MIIKVDFRCKNGKSECVIFGHEKGGKSWKENLEAYLIQQTGGKDVSEYKRCFPQIVLIEQASGNSPKGFRWSRPNNWSKHTGQLLPTFKPANQRTEGSVEKAIAEILSSNSEKPKKPSKKPSRRKKQKETKDVEIESLGSDNEL